ncbi:SCP2 sterol-binding domain-containing protein [Actinomarinicola tropica]|uniref:SCP2 sterol-binding domain-containing protein n=1 Tax=Actinomarinicola tropica TaxID=2789776 RepID=UPI00189B6CAF|nr:SCP2 sterol-binding domain-containing protein [Actinomarinicola tropica]
MVTFLSPAWVAELDAAAQAAPELTDVLGSGEELVVQHVVTDDAGDERAAFHLRLGAGACRAHPGHADEPTVTFTQTEATARQISQGTLGAQAAFMSGHLRLGGRVDVLLTHHAALSGISDVFAVVRERTDW